MTTITSNAAVSSSVEAPAFVNGAPGALSGLQVQTSDLLENKISKITPEPKKRIYKTEREKSKPIFEKKEEKQRKFFIIKPDCES